MHNVSGLWKKVSKGGKTYLSGQIGPIRVLIFRNEKKTREEQPDWVLYFDFAEPKPKDASKDVTEDEGDPFNDLR